MRTVTVSVVIPVFNRYLSLGKALESVFSQTFKDYEVIVVDDASIDSTPQLLKSLSDRVEIIRLKQHTGYPSVVRNAGMRKSAGEYIAFLDSDDVWLPLKLEKQVAYMREHPEYEFTHTYCRKVDANGSSLGVRHEERLPPSGDCVGSLVGHCLITTSTVVLKRSLLSRVGYFNEAPDFRTGEDYEFFLRVAGVVPIGLIDEVLACYREAQTGISQDDFNWRAKPQYVRMQLDLLRRPDLWRGRIERREIVASLVDNCIENSGYWRGRGWSGRAAYFAVEALRYAPMNARVWMELAKSLLKPVMPAHGM